MPYRFEDRSEWRYWVTPKGLRSKPIHNWYVFPHSFTSELVHALIKEWGLTANDHILDLFEGAGTTILSAKEKGIPATGYDLSPLAVLASSCKIADYDLIELELASASLDANLAIASASGTPKNNIDLIKNALPVDHICVFENLVMQIEALPITIEERNFFLLGLLATLPIYSRAVAAGGWLRFVEKQTEAENIPDTFFAAVRAMLDDLRNTVLPKGDKWNSRLADARCLPSEDEAFSAVISSPPYPNRHDYSRVFGVELMFQFLDWNQTRDLRYQLLHSHVEAKPLRPNSDNYVPPDSVIACANELRRRKVERRIPTMIEGYFLDMFLCLSEIKRVCKPGAKIALVLGNVQYVGAPVLVDEWTAEVAEQAGLSVDRLIVARRRGNSAQQMGVHGIQPSRETVIILKRP